MDVGDVFLDHGVFHSAVFCSDGLAFKVHVVLVLILVLLVDQEVLGSLVVGFGKVDALFTLRGDVDPGNCHVDFVRLQRHQQGVEIHVLDF